jgi:transposase
MDHIAIDLGSRESQVCVRTAEGEILEERRVGTRSLGKYLARRPKSRVVLEACAEAFPVADAALLAGHETVVVPASLAPSLGVGERGVKTDVRDARNLSEASCRMGKLPRVHIPTQESRDRKAMCGLREGLVQARTKLMNTVRGWTRPQGLGVIRSGAPATFPLRVSEHVKDRDRTIPPYVEQVLKSIQSLTEQIAEADQGLEKAAASDPTCKLLMTAPGVGPTTAVRFAAAVDNVERFPNAHRLESYLGLTPGENSSSQRKRKTALTKAGPSKLRWVLVQAAWAARRFYKDDPLVLWSKEVEKRRGKQVAVMALARRLAGTLYAMWRDASPYNKNHRNPETRGSNMPA